MNSEPEIAPDLAAQLLELRECPPRDPQRAVRARNAFVAEVSHTTARVSNLLPNRLNGWQERLRVFWFTTRKEKSNVFNFVLTMLIALAVVFGGGATGLVAAQSAQPNDALYPVKTWSEDLRLGWVPDPQDRLDLALQFAARRTEEIRTLLQAEGVVPTPVLTRLQSQLQQVLGIAAGMPNDQIVPALERARNQARQQEQTMAQLQLVDPIAIQTRARVRTMLQVQAQDAEGGIEDPIRLRERLQRRDGGITTPSDNSAVGEGVTPAPGNPWTTGVPTPGSSYGPGGSQNPWTDGTPTPGSGYGPGPGTGECTDCTGEPNQDSGGSQGNGQGQDHDQGQGQGQGQGPGSGR
jgi:hypothetical protein